MGLKSKNPNLILMYNELLIYLNNLNELEFAGIHFLQ